MAQTATEEATNLLNRLSQKPGVQSVLILSRETGAIIRSSGLPSSTTNSNPNSALPPSISADQINGNQTSSSVGIDTGLVNRGSDERNGLPARPRSSHASAGVMSAEEVARKVWSFLSAAGGLARDLLIHNEGDGEQDRDSTINGYVRGQSEQRGAALDDVKLLRLRTKNNEIVIIPDKKFLLVVIHATPTA
ncbi:hypothetical protein L228DRAFT_270152 [Xylona heveae TC161]|uniref:Roadblock/LAMTOR2 domain-containing protein n=1 Tax=Xylona heveae (strain CBS 132557 / TC161) TaxID=1328760 RepID=A0A165FEE4_XYLHT|nr:hypothetical protein L228DRAFT_270152 [Xylona heveae TC161]KZF20885.1 hypothetical protein L228DRAFT_270152 [Xylona heveae TC161]